MRQTQRLPRTRSVTLRAVVVNDALRAGNSVYRREDQRAELIDKLVLEECTIDPATAFKKQLPGTEERGQLLHGQRQIIAFCAGENIRHTIVAKLGEVG